MLLALVCAGSAAFSLWRIAGFAVDVGYFYGYNRFNEALRDTRLSTAFLREASFLSYAVKRVYVTFDAGEAFDDGTVLRETERIKREQYESFREEMTESFREELFRFGTAVMRGEIVGEQAYTDEKGNTLQFPIYEYEGANYSAAYFLGRDEFTVNEDGGVSLNDDYFRSLAEDYGVSDISVADCRKQYDRMKEYISTVKSMRWMLVDSGGNVFTNTAFDSAEAFTEEYADSGWFVSSRDDFSSVTVNDGFGEASAKTDPEPDSSALPARLSGGYAPATKYTAAFFREMRNGYQSQLRGVPDYHAAEAYPDSGKRCTVYLSYDSAVVDTADPFYTIESGYSASVAALTVHTALLLGSLALCLVTSLVFIALAGKKYRRAPAELSLEDRIPGDLRLVLALGFAAAFLFLGGVIASYGLGQTGLKKHAVIAAFVAVAVGLEGTLLDYAACFVRRCRCKRAFRDLIVLFPVRIIERLKGNNSKLDDGVKRQFKLTAPLFLIPAGLDLIVIIYSSHKERYLLLMFSLIVLAALAFVALSILYRYAKSLDVIRAAVEEAHKGNYDVEYTAEKMPETMTRLAERISNLREGFRRAVETATRDQRTKTELITNVSHDLKTPLTSIITYSDLLSRLRLGDPAAEEYAEVINEKSLRLKQLIEDLIEASKASTGNVKLEIVEIDLRELALQAIGENEEALENAGIEMVITENGSRPIVLADGGKTYRVFENVISNVVKYAVRGTKATVTLNCTPDFGVISFKNVSAVPLGDMDADHLLERFVRGDAARSGEGSGLGLAIASDLCSLQGGSFKVSAEGDSFTAAVSLPLSPDRKVPPGPALPANDEEKDTETEEQG